MAQSRRPWDDTLACIQQLSPDLPVDWIELNYEVDEIIRSRLQGIVNKAPEGSKAFFKNVRNVFWGYWCTFSEFISQALFWPESEVHCIWPYFNGMLAVEYLQLCGCFQRAETVVQRRSRDAETNVWLTVLAGMFGLDRAANNLWLQVSALAEINPDVFAAFVVVMLNTEVDELLTLPTVVWPSPEVLTSATADAVIATGTTRKWHGLLYLISEENTKRNRDPGFEAWVNEAFKNTTPTFPPYA